jgi:hypothetical protein
MQHFLMADSRLVATGFEGTIAMLVAVAEFEEFEASVAAENMGVLAMLAVENVRAWSASTF